MSPPLNLDEIIENFEFLEEWDDKYRYVIELGRILPDFSDDQRSDDYKVQGCVSQVWLIKTVDADNGLASPTIHYQGDSDAHIVKGLVAIVLAIFSGKTAREIQNIDTESVFQQIGLREHLTPQRSNGLSSMISKIKSDAAEISALAS